jgi:uncharacterized protein (UPF0261 family)
MAIIAVAGTLDTKGPDHEFVADCIRSHGHEPLLIDWGTQHPPTVTPQISRADVAAAAGLDLAALTARGDRGECVAAMSAAAPVLLSQLYTSHRIDGVISLRGRGDAGASDWFSQTHRHHHGQRQHCPVCRHSRHHRDAVGG